MLVSRHRDSSTHAARRDSYPRSEEESISAISVPFLLDLWQINSLDVGGWSCGLNASLELGGDLSSYFLRFSVWPQTNCFGSVMHMRLDWTDTSHVKVGTTDPILILLSVKYGVATLPSCTLQVCLVYNCLGLGPVSQDMLTWWILRWCSGIWARLQRQKQLSCCSSAVLLGLGATGIPAMWVLESMLVKAT